MKWASAHILRNGWGGKESNQDADGPPTGAPQGVVGSVPDLESKPVLGARFCAYQKGVGKPQFPYLENKEVGLGKSFSMCGPQTSSINMAWKLVRNADSQASLRPTESETVEMGPSNPCLTSPPGDLKEFTNQPLVDNV